MDEIRVLPPEPTILPEEKLFLAVLKRAILDYIEFRKTKDYEWFFSDDCKQICEWVNVDQSWLTCLVRVVKK